jgi:hypothetical protein
LRFGILFSSSDASFCFLKKKWVVQAVGTFHELMAASPAFSDLMSEFGLQHDAPVAVATAAAPTTTAPAPTATAASATSLAPVVALPVAPITATTTASATSPAPVIALPVAPTAAADIVVTVAETPVLTNDSAQSSDVSIVTAAAAATAPDTPIAAGPMGARTLIRSSSGTFSKKI